MSEHGNDHAQLPEQAPAPPPAPDSPLEAQIFAEQVAAVYKLTPFTLAMSMVGSTLVFLSLLPSAPLSHLLAWYLMHHLVYASRYLLIRRYRQARPGPDEAPMWGRRFVVGTTAAGLIWAIPASLLLPHYGDPIQFFVALYILGVVATGMFSLAQYLRAFLPLAVFPLVGMAAALLSSNAPGQQISGAACLLFLYIVLVNARRYQAMTRGAIRMRLEMVQLAEDRARASAAAEQASRAKTQFLANMSHEIRTPMTGVLGLTQLMLAGELAPRQREYAESLLGAGQSLLRLLNDVLDLARSEAGQLTIEHIEFDLSETVEDIARLFAHAARTKQLKLSCSYDPDLPERLIGDPFRLRQVLSNLVSNAIKFTEQGTINIRVIANGPVRTDSVLLRIEVADTGIGISPEAAKRLFGAFAQGDDSMSRRYGGSGLGLAISRQIVSKMGGEIGFHSDSAGSVFYVDLEMDKQPVSIARPIFGAPQLSYFLEFPDRQCKLLLAEDNPTNRLLLVAMLELIGRFEILAAEDGQEAVAAFREVDLVLMDCQMPTMDGYEAARQIREIEHLEGGQPVSIVALTAHSLPQERQRCTDAGMNDFLSKPVLMRDLAQCLERHLPALQRNPGKRS